MAGFIIDTWNGVVHRESTMTDTCRASLQPGKVQSRGSELEATLVMKTRHYAACARCYHPL